MASTKQDLRQIEAKTQNFKQLGLEIKSSLNEIVDKIDTDLDFPLKLSATFPVPDSKIRFTNSKINAPDGTNKVSPPVKKQIFQGLSSLWVDFQTKTVSNAIDFDIDWPSVNTVGRFRHVGFTLIGSGKIKALFSEEAATEVALANPGGFFVANGLPIGYITLQCTNALGYFKTAGSTTSVIESAKVFRFGSGAGGGGGTGDANSFTENLKHRLVNSYYDYVTPVVFETDEKTFTSSATAAYDIVNSAYAFTNSGDFFESTQLFDSEFLSNDDDSRQLELHAEWLSGPSAEIKESASLELNFTKNEALDPRIIFTRPSIATRTNSSGLIEIVSPNAPRFDYDPVKLQPKGLLIEEQRQNLLQYTENFDNATWTRTRVSVLADAEVAPDGTRTADKLVEDTTANNTHVVTSSFSVTSGTTYTISVFAKASERSVLIINVNDSEFGTNSHGSYDLSTGTSLSSSTGAGNPIRSITQYPNGWYRCVLTVTAISTAASSSISLNLSDVAIDVAVKLYTGDGTSGIFIWGTQLEVGSYPTSYIPSTNTFTSRASTATFIGSNGLIQTAATNVARQNYRADRLDLAPKLLLEESRQNLLQRSEEFNDVYWTKARSSIQADVTIAPDGTLTADKLVEDTSDDTHLLARAFSFVSGSTYTVSFFAKAGERNRIGLQFPSTAFTTAINVNFDLISGTVVTVGAGSTASITPLNNGWYRCAATATATTTINATFIVARPIISGINSAYLGDGTSGLFIWGAQLEVGAYPTSYIPTTTAAVTRSADVSTSTATTRNSDQASMTGTNFSSWFREDEGSFVAKYTAPIMAATGTNPYLFSASKDTDNRIALRISTTPNIFPDIVTNATGQLSSISSPVPYGATRTTAMAFKTNSFAVSTSGRASLLDNSVSLPTALTTFRIGASPASGTHWNGHISSILFYPKRLTNAQLETLSEDIVCEFSIDGSKFEVVDFDYQAKSAKITGSKLMGLPTSTRISNLVSNSSIELNATTTQAISSAFTLASKNAASRLSVNLIKAGNPAGFYSVKICKNDGQTPGDAVYIKSGSMSSLSVGNNEIDLSGFRIILPVGTYNILVETDSAYKTSFVANSNSIRVTGQTTGGTVYNGSSWVAGPAIGYSLYGHVFDLRLRVTSYTTSRYLKAFGVFYNEKVGNITTGVQALQKFTFSGSANINEFTVTGFLPDADHMKVYDIRTGQVYRYPAFSISGHTVTFNSNTFLAPGETVELIFDQSQGTGYDNSDTNASLLAANHLGSVDGTIDKSRSGRGIFLRRPDGTLREICIDNNDNIVIYSV